MTHTSESGAATERGLVTRAVEVVLDPSLSQERWLRSCVGSMRAAYNWAVEQAADNLEVRRAERERGVAEDELTPAFSWSRESLGAAWRAVRDEVHPWHRDVSIMRSGPVWTTPRSRSLAGGFDLVCIEDLNVAGMARRKGLRNGRSVAEASMGELTRQLDYKTSDRDVPLIRVGRNYPSTQTCSQCGARTKLALWQRVYNSIACGLVLDRDVTKPFKSIAVEGGHRLGWGHARN